MSELTDLVENLEQKYGSPLKYVPHNDPDFITIQKKYWRVNDPLKHLSHKKQKHNKLNGKKIMCKVIDRTTGEEHVFASFTKASKFYGYNKNWVCELYMKQRNGHQNSKYKVVKLDKGEEKTEKR